MNMKSVIIALVWSFKEEHSKRNEITESQFFLIFIIYNNEVFKFLIKKVSIFRTVFSFGMMLLCQTLISCHC